MFRLSKISRMSKQYIDKIIINEYLPIVISHHQLPINKFVKQDSEGHNILHEIDIKDENFNKIDSYTRFYIQSYLNIHGKRSHFENYINKCDKSTSDKIKNLIYNNTHFQYGEWNLYKLCTKYNLYLYGCIYNNNTLISTKTMPLLPNTNPNLFIRHTVPKVSELDYRQISQILDVIKQID